MIYLLDTHYLLWSVFESRKISKKIVDEIKNPENNIVVSPISFWEISIKYGLGKLHLPGFTPEDLPDLCRQMDMGIQDITTNDLSTYHLLTATYHKDPFDRMLIWQAIRNKLTLISIDSNIQKYASEGLRLF